MSCCPSHILPFNNTGSTVIGYTETMRNIYGRYPDVQIYYMEDSGEYVRAINPSGIRLTVNHDLVETITVDHGGLQVGFIKIV